MALAEMGETRAIPILRSILDQAKTMHDCAAMDACMLLGDWPGGAGLGELARSSGATRRCAMAVSMVARSRQYDAVAEIYRELLGDADPAVRQAAEDGLKFVEFMRGRKSK